MQHRSGGPQSCEEYCRALCEHSGERRIRRQPSHCASSLCCNEIGRMHALPLANDLNSGRERSQRSQYICQPSTGQGHIEWLFPGRSCPGLIEGTSPTGMDSGCSAGFRGEAAPASLKAHQFAGTIDVLEGSFRGEAAPASLKHAHDMLEEQVHLRWLHLCGRLPQGGQVVPPLAARQPRPWRRRGPMPASPPVGFPGAIPRKRRHHKAATRPCQALCTGPE